MVIALPDVGIFGVQIRPGFRPFEDHLIVIIVNVAEGVDRAHRLRLARGLLLVKLHFIGLQSAVPLIDINVAGKYGVIRIVAFRMIGIDRHRQVVGFPFNQRTIVAWYAKHTLRGEIGSEALLAIQGAGNHGGRGWEYVFSYVVFVVPSSCGSGLQTVRA